MADKELGEILFAVEADGEGFRRAVWIETDQLPRYQTHARTVIVLDTTYNFLGDKSMDMKLHAIVYPNEFGNTEPLAFAFTRNERAGDYAFIFDSLLSLVRPHCDADLLIPAVRAG